MKKEKQPMAKNRILTIILSIALAVMFVATLVGLVVFRMQISGSSADSLNEYKEYDRWYALITQDSDDTFWNSVYESMCIEGDATNAYIERFGANLPSDYSKQELMEIAIASKVDGIILEADDSNETDALISKATAAGIPVVTVFQDSQSRVRRSYVGPSNYNLGSEYGNMILRAARAQRNRQMQNTNPGRESSDIDVMILLDENEAGTSQNIILTAMQETLESGNNYGMNISTRAKTIETDNIFSSEETIRSILQGTDSATPNMIVCLSEANTKNVFQAVVDQNKVGEVAIIGYYDSESILKAIDKGIVYATASIDTRQMGEYCVSALNEYLESGYVNEYYSVDFTMIDQANVARYLEEKETNETK